MRKKSGSETNQQGQSLGDKGRRTRARLLEAATKLLKTRSVREMTVMDIAKRAKTSSATFYLYFKDVEDVVLALTHQTGQGSDALLRLLEKPWNETEMLGNCVEFINLYRANWETNREVLRARNLEADRGNEKFILSRLDDALPILDTIAAKIVESHNLTSSEQHKAFALGSVIYSAMERIAATHPVKDRVRGVWRNEIRDAEAILLAILISGSIPSQFLNEKQIFIDPDI